MPADLPVTGSVPVAAVEEAAGGLSEAGSRGGSGPELAKAMAAIRRTTTPTTVIRLREGRGVRRGGA
ncbi:hypothetical protein ADK75_20115 [Streptomyces virginiae]|uniref:Uncharacterized protein n=1 Tax=Streptomyces virginiae TaxID=1961 RepID=A0A0L8MF39_STRVG|nr:hypothetical protein ADK75_20115 [Streptomyces virginiae]